MEDFLRRLAGELGQWSPVWAYGFLSISALLENLIPPVPGDTVVVLGAYLVGRGVLDLWPAYLATCAGGTAGFLIVYYLGYSRGRDFLVGGKSRFFAPESVARAERWLARYGGILVLVNRFLSGIRSVIALSAGIGGMDWKRVALYGSISMAVWNGLLIYLGAMVGRNWEEVSGWIARYNRFAGAGAGGVLALLAVRWWIRVRAAKKGKKGNA